MRPDAVPTRLRLLAGALLILLLAVGAPSAAQGHWHPPRPHPHPHPHPPGAPGGKDDDEDDDGAPSGTAPASTAIPPSTAAPATSAAPAMTSTTTAAPAPAPVAVSAPTAAAPPPELGRTVAFAVVSGTVTVRVPGGGTVPLTAAVALPTGTRVDTRSGEVELASALDDQGHTQTGRFSGGVFEVRQPKGGKGLTRIVLVGGHWGDCKISGYVTRAGPTAKAAARKKARKPIRKLWGHDDHGKFETRGGGSVATVRGTRWLTSDTCNGTRTTVVEGAVAVKSRKTGRTHLVTAGHTIFIHR